MSAMGGTQGGAGDRPGVAQRWQPRGGDATVAGQGQRRRKCAAYRAEQRARRRARTIQDIVNASNSLLHRGSVVVDPMKFLAEELRSPSAGPDIARSRNPGTEASADLRRDVNMLTTALEVVTCKLDALHSLVGRLLPAGLEHEEPRGSAMPRGATESLARSRLTSTSATTAASGAMFSETEGGQGTTSCGSGSGGAGLSASGSDAQACGGDAAADTVSSAMGLGHASCQSGGAVGSAPVQIEGMDQKFAFHDFVFIQGIVAKPELNGRKGQVTSYAADTGRYGISIGGKASVGLKEQHLRRFVDDPSTKEGRAQHRVKLARDQCDKRGWKEMPADVHTIMNMRDEEYHVFAETLGIEMLRGPRKSKPSETEKT